jgi:riboflavin kinase/FMN adenylyltransferase
LLPAELLPALGVYVSRLTVAGRCFQSVTNLGNRPTFGEPSFAVESHLLDFEPIDMDEDTPIDLEFLLRLRSEIKFPSLRSAEDANLQRYSQGQTLFPLGNVTRAGNLQHP